MWGLINDCCTLCPLYTNYSYIYYFLIDTNFLVLVYQIAHNYNWFRTHSFWNHRLSFDEVDHYLGCGKTDITNNSARDFSLSYHGFIWFCSHRLLRPFVPEMRSRRPLNQVLTLSRAINYLINIAYVNRTLLINSIYNYELVWCLIWLNDPKMNYEWWNDGSSSEK